VVDHKHHEGFKASRKSSKDKNGEWNMVKVVITGISGFIGSNLAKRLVELGYHVFGVIRPCANRSLELIKDILDDIVLLGADITDFFSISNALKTVDPDYVCHLAALTPVRLSFEKPFEYERTNYLGTMNIVHAILELPDYETRKLVFASTPEVYGFHTNGKPLSEDASLNPTSPYAVSKAAADMYVRMASCVYNLNAVIIRPANTYGRAFEKGFMVEYLVTSMLKKERVYIGAPESIREYQYVDDHVNAYIQAIKRGKKGEVYNIGTGEGIENRHLAERIAQKVGYDVDKLVLGSYPPKYPLRPIASDQPYIILDSAKAKQQLDWSPRVSLDEGLEKTINHWKSKLATR
jgi:dTDP-glucose 4,6-dehydratase